MENYIREMKAASDLEFNRNGYTIGKPEFSYTTGKKFHKVLRTSHRQTSVHCFVDIETGDIYKAASYKIPAKGIRGNIKNAKKPLIGRDFYR